MHFQLLNRNVWLLHTSSLKKVFTVLFIALFCVVPSSDAASLRRKRQNDLKNQHDQQSVTFFMENTAGDSEGDSYGSLVNELKNNSVCPWDTDQDIEDDRYPRILNKVSECKCVDCKEVNDTTMACQKVKANIPVLMKKKTDATGRIEYEATTVTLPVACVCAKLKNRGS